MKLLFPLLFFVSYVTFAQQESNSPQFLTLEEVDNPPAFPGCEAEDFKSCSSQGVAGFLMQKIDPNLLFSLEEAENYVNIRFIVDSSGKVRRPMVTTGDERLRVAANKLLKTLPNFTPGTHNGEPVNVIIDVPVKLARGNSSIAENTFKAGEDPGADAWEEKIFPIATACEKNASPKRCTSQWVQQFFLRNFNTYKVRVRNKMLKVTVYFTIDEEGKVTNVTAEGENEKMKKAAIKAAQKLPDFIPATEDGKNIPYEYKMPVTVQG